MYNWALPSRTRAGIHRKDSRSVWPEASLHAELAKGQACVHCTQVTRVREYIKKRLSFGPCRKGALIPPPLILDGLEVTFVSAHFGQQRGSFYKGPTFKYLPNILEKSASKLLEPCHTPPPLPPFNVQKKVKLGENKTASKLLDYG